MQYHLKKTTTYFTANNNYIPIQIPDKPDKLQNSLTFQTLLNFLTFQVFPGEWEPCVIRANKNIH